jgi:hypothetical protein
MRDCHVNREKVTSRDFHASQSKTLKAQSAKVPKTHGAHPSMVVKTHDVRPPRQIWEIILREIFLLNIQISQMSKLAPSLNMVKRILELANEKNLAGALK